MFNVRSIAFVVAGSLWLFPHTAAAQSLTGNVGSAAVNRGERSIEARFGANDQGNAAARIHFDYAFTDWYQLRTIASFSRPEGGDWDVSGLTFENWLQWSEEARDGEGFNGGVRLAYTFRDGGGPDEAAVRFTITDRFAEQWEWRANLIGEIETGDGSEGGVALASRLQVTRAVALWPPLETRLGVELFSEYGDTRDIADPEDQAHQIGPVLKAEWGEGFYLQTAVRVGLTDATDDAMFKLFFGREL
ncbi:hypothetical protein GC173_12160 [bacterium]|nr:hypothetical protein [bacterium]